MQPIQILIVGTNQPIMQTIARLIDKDGKWQATIALSLNSALEFCYAKDFSLVLIGAGIDEAEENIIKLHLETIGLIIPVIKHYGGGSGLLFAEIFQALGAH
jgi:hypothetical protein